MMTRFSLYVCESQPVVVEGLKRIFEAVEDVEFLGHAPDLSSTTQELTTHTPDLLLVGQPPTTRSALPLLAQIRESNLTPRIVLWVGEISEMDSFRALQMGARGILGRSQSVAALLDCLRTVSRGSVWIDGTSRSQPHTTSRNGTALRVTRREREIIEFICRGMKNKEIAEALSITPGTVKVHLMHIFEKTGVKDRFQLALQGRQLLGQVAGEIEVAQRRTAEV